MEFLKSLKLLQSLVNSTSSSIEKQKILKKHSTEQHKKLYELIYNPNTNFHITSKNVNKKTMTEGEKIFKDLFDLLYALINEISGNNAIYAVQEYIKLNNEYEEQILNIIDKDLKMGMNVKQINKVFPNLITTFSVSLGENFNSDKHKLDENWYISRKLDGVRCICKINKKGKVRLYSRQGKEFWTLDKVKIEIEKLGLKDIVLDGEIAIMENGNENFQEVMKEIRKKGHTIKNPKYFIFDILTIQEFENQISERKFRDRNNSIFCSGDNILTKLGQMQYNVDNFRIMQENVEKYNWEGLILRKDAIYKGKRTNDLLKVKKFKDDEFMVKNIEINKMRQYSVQESNYIQVETLGSVIIDYKGYNVSVGSGFSMEERNEYYKNPNKIIGKLITVKYFEETRNKEGELSLRFPVFKTIVGESRET